MSFLRSRSFILYITGIGSVAAGAQVSSMTNSMLPLALGGATAVMTTWGLVKAIRNRRKATTR